MYYRVEASDDHRLEVRVEPPFEKQLYSIPTRTYTFTQQTHSHFDAQMHKHLDELLEAAEAEEKLIRKHGCILHVAVPGAMETRRK